ncbi:MAG: carbohydrate kinase family protein [Ardenticatenales bacterium]|nr:carbohydrate kinase family protein [Ardenticatenales bacterium]
MNILFGQSDLDIYLPENKTFPGGGAHNMAYHWRQLGVPFRLLTRIARDRSHYFVDFHARHGIRLLEEAALVEGRAGSSDIWIRPDGEVIMDNWIEGIGATIQLTPAEMVAVSQADWLHAFLIPAVVAELKKMRTLGYLAETTVSGDFFDFAPFTLATFRDTLALVDLGFLGWQKELTDATLTGIRAIVQEQQKMLIVTLGAHGVMVYDGRPDSPLPAPGPGMPGEQFFPTRPVPVLGTTVGCGDAFAAHFLAEWQRSGDLARAVRAGQAAGARATGWRRCLPAEAYV